MSIRTVKNVTSMGVKRTCRRELGETVNAAGLVAVENNTNILGADVSVPNDIVYAGADYLPSGTDQYDANDA